LLDTAALAPEVEFLIAGGARKILVQIEAWQEGR
jgi:hypothetical protein